MRMVPHNCLRRPLSSQARGAAHLPLPPHVLAGAWRRTTVSPALCPRAGMVPHNCQCCHSHLPQRTQRAHDVNNHTDVRLP